MTESKVDEKFMKIAIKEAEKGDYPFGAVIVKNNKIVSKAHNTAGRLDPTAHAEVVAIRKACKKLKSIDLSGCTLYTSCEPCPMCFTAAWWAHVSMIVYGMEGEDVTEEDWKIDVKCDELNKRSGKRIQIKGSILRNECKELLKLIK